MVYGTIRKSYVVTLLSSLGQPQFLCYLRATTTPKMKQQRRVNLDDGTGRYKIIWYPLHKLRSFVRNAIKPECEIDSPVENLLKYVFKQYSYKVLILIERNSSMSSISVYMASQSTIQVRLAKTTWIWYYLFRGSHFEFRYVYALFFVIVIWIL